MLKKSDIQALRELGLATIRELETDKGILASGREEIFGCIFGRDSLIVCMKLLRAFEQTGDEYFLALSRKILANLAALQGTEVNIESGEEPGKMIHEYRPDNHEHLTKHQKRPWYVYDDGAMRNYDSVDSTPLFLMAAYRLYEASRDRESVSALLPNVRAALDWIMSHGDANGDGLIDYRFHPGRTFGGLLVQNWMDSTESMFHEDGSAVAYPIAPLEVQAYAYTALRMWGSFFAQEDRALADSLDARAQYLKTQFNETFVLFSGRKFTMPAGIDGNGKPIMAARSSMGHILWAAWKRPGDAVPDSILEAGHIPQLVRRIMRPDIFEKQAGFRTLSSASKHFLAISYHNGSIWPHDTGMIAEGLEKFGYAAEAAKARRALTKAMLQVNAPVELLSVASGTAGASVSTGKAENGQKSCTKQAWSAATLLTELYTRRWRAAQPIPRGEESAGVRDPVPA